RNPEKCCRFFPYAVSKDLARQEAETPPDTAGVGRRRPRNLVGAGREGRGSIMAGAGDRNRKRISVLPLAFTPAIARCTSLPLSPSVMEHLRRTHVRHHTQGEIRTPERRQRTCNNAEAPSRNHSSRSARAVGS